MSLLAHMHKIKESSVAMVIKIFKISTKEMWTIRNKESLCEFIYQETGIEPDRKLTVFNLVKCLPRENYYRVK
jgi:hypothetical protein